MSQTPIERSIQADIDLASATHSLYEVANWLRGMANLVSNPERGIELRPMPSSLRTSRHHRSSYGAIIDQSDWKTWQWASRRIEAYTAAVTESKAARQALTDDERVLLPPTLR